MNVHLVIIQVQCVWSAALPPMSRLPQAQLLEIFSLWLHLFFLSFFGTLAVGWFSTCSPCLTDRQVGLLMPYWYPHRTENWIMFLGEMEKKNVQPNDLTTTRLGRCLISKQRIDPCCHIWLKWYWYWKAIWYEIMVFNHDYSFISGMIYLCSTF